MRYLTALILVWFSLHPVNLAEAQLSATDQSSQPPGARAWLVGDHVTLDQSGVGSFQIGVEVPPDHHGYLDKGDDGLLIPFAFTFASLEAQGARVAVLSRPPGERDDDVRATVLRGSGDPPSTALTASPAVGTSEPQAVPSHGAQQTEVEVRGNLSWLRDFTVAQQRARVEQQPIFVDFYATWCANCKEFERLAIRQTKLNTALQQAVLVKIYDTDPIFPTFQRDPHFPELGGVGGQPFLPLFAIYTSQGQFVWKGQDYRAVHTMIAQLDRARGEKL